MIPPFWDPASQLQEAFNFLFDLMMQFLTVSLDFGSLAIVQWLFGNAAGLAPILAISVFFFILPGAIFVRRLRLSGALALTIVLLGPAIAAGWFFAIDALNAIGDGLTRMVGTIDSTPDDVKSSIITIPPIPFSNPLIDILMFVSLIWGTFNFLQLFMGYELYNIFLATFGLLLVAMYGLGPRTRRLFSILIAIGLSSLVLGRPIAILIMKLGNMLGNALPIANTGWLGLVTASSMLVAMIVSIALPFGLYKTVNAVMGRMLATVSNVVRSRIENKHKVDANVSGKVSTTSTNRAESVNSKRYSHSMATETRRMAGNTSSAALTGVLKKAAVAGSNVHPVAKVAVLGGAAALSGIGNAAPKERKNPLDAYR